MKKILGLDIGTTSIGWAIVEAIDQKIVNMKTGETAVSDINNERVGIHNNAIGVRIIPQNSDNVKSFNEGKRLNIGKTSTPAAKRRQARGSRRMKSRYKLRRSKLANILALLKMSPDEKYYTNQKGKRGSENDIGKAIYELRARAIREEITLSEWGRVLMHLNQWRGYSSDRFKKSEKEETQAGITATVIKIENGEDYTTNQKKGGQSKEATYNTFIIHFDNGDTAIEVRSKENSESDFVLDELYTYTFKNEDEINGYKQINKKKTDTDSWAYRKKELNTDLKTWCQSGGTVGSYFYNKYYAEKIIDRIRNNTVDRDWYEDEFDKAWDFQFEKHKSNFENLNIEDVVKAAFKDYNAILTSIKKQNGIKEQLRHLIKEKIIFFQRPWQQVKNKGECPFEFVPDVKKEKDGSFTPNMKGKKVIDKSGKEIFVKGRTVIPRSHPLLQDYKIWQQINNVRLFLNKEDERIDLFSDNKLFKQYTEKTIEEVKLSLFDALQKSKTLSWRVFVKNVLGIKNLFDELENKQGKRTKKGVDVETGEISNTYFSVNFRKRKKDNSYDDIKLKGNTTKATLQNILNDKTEEWFYQIHSDKQPISNLQLLWEIIYDITNSKAEDVAQIIKKHFDFDNAICNQLAVVKFDDTGMGNLSAKAIRQLLPLMSNGNNLTKKAQKRIESLITLNNSEQTKDDDDKLESIKNFVSDKKSRLCLSKFSKMEDFRYLNYWEAAAVVYGSHSSKKTIIQPEIQRVKQHSLNNPVVEKIVNETISIVNEIQKTYGFDEVRIELSRELKASMDERQQMWEATQAGYEKNEWAKKMLREIKKALTESNRSVDNIDNETSTKSNLDKMRIIEDVVKFQQKEEYKKKEKEYKLDEPSKAEITKYLFWLEQNFKCPYTNQPIPLTDIFAKGKVVEIEHIIPRERYYSNAYSNKVITWQEVNQAKANNGNRTAYEFIVSKRVENTVKVGNREYPLVSVDDWQKHIEAMFPKGAKRNNLLRKEIPEEPIERTLKETQYINKKLKEKLAELVGESKVWVTSGAVTDILREKWHLNDVMKELLRERFQKFKIPTGKKTFQLKTIKEQKSFLEELNSCLNYGEEFNGFKKKIGKKDFEFDLEEATSLSEQLSLVIKENETEGIKTIKPFKYASSKDSFDIKSLVHRAKEFNKKTDKYEDVEKFTGYSKRIDHRHHALDALIIACTKQNHIQYINNLNKINTADQEDEDTKKEKYKTLKDEICVGNSSTKFKTPWDKDKFIVDAKNALNEIIVSHKNTRLLISPSKHRVDKEIKSGKVASIRGELHKETNYAKRNYFNYINPDRIDISKLIPLLFKRKKENQYQMMVHFKSFEEIIKETVLKEKYQSILIPLFTEYDDKRLNDILVKEYSKLVLKKIADEKLLIDSKTQQPLQWLSVYADKDKSSRPLGLSMDLNNSDEVKKIADPRIKRLAQYRLNYVNELLKSIDGKKDLDKREKDKLKAEAKGLKLYSNAIYEVRINKGENQFKWVELKDLQPSNLEKVSYAKSETTKLIKDKLANYDLDKLKKNYFENPVFLSDRPIEVKKARQKSYYQNLYEITPKRYVQVEETFMTYFFQEQNNKTRKPVYLKFVDAVAIVNTEKPSSIDYKMLIEKEKTNEEDQANAKYGLIFTLANNDLVYLPNKELVDEEIKAIDWNNLEAILPYLYTVKEMNPSIKPNGLMRFQQFYKADSIAISSDDTKELFDIETKNGLSEEIKYGTINMLQRCIKVFTDKLGKKIVPYWEFPNGCWNNEKAKELGLIRINT